MNENTNKQRIDMTAMMSIAITLAAFGTGCTPTPEEDTDPTIPIDCNDLKASAPTLKYVDSFGPIQFDEEMEAGRGFRVQWFVEFRRGLDMNYLGGTGEYTARVSFIEDGEEVLVISMDATPLNVASGDWDSINIDEGLPAGDYTIRVVLDPDHEVPQCGGLIFGLNNIAERDITVVGETIDDVATASGGASPSTEAPNSRDPNTREPQTVD